MLIFQGIPKNVAWTTPNFPLFGLTTGMPKTGAGSPDSEIDKDDGGFNDCTNEVAESGTTGYYNLAFAQAEMNADQITVQIKTTDCYTQTIIILTGGVNVAQIGGDAQSLADLKKFADDCYQPTTNQVYADMVAIQDVVQSCTDFKDLVDAGYDPSTHKVQGVVLTDTVTTYTGNTKQTGDVYAKLPTNFEDLAIVDTAGTVKVPDTQKVDIETIKTKGITCGAAVTVNAVVGTATAGALESTLTTLRGADSDTLETLSGQLDLVASAGTGATTCTYTCEDDDGDPIENVQVWLSTDSSGTPVYASGITNSSGQVVFYLDVGDTYYVFRQKAGVNFTNPQTWSV